MANTVTLLNYANTFGDWVVTTNALAIENNNLAANNYTKATGTLFLNAPATGLQVANNATIQGQLAVSGVGSSAVIQNNLTVSQGTIFAANTTGLGLRIDGVANIATLNIIGTGNALQVANNAVVSGIIRVGGAAGLSSTLTVADSTVSDSVTANAYTQTPLSYATLSYSDRLIANTGIASQFISASDSVYSNYFYGNTAIQSETLITTGTANVASITANSHVNTSTIYASTLANVQALFSNSYVSGVTGSFKDLSVSGDFIINGSTIYDSDRFLLKGGSPITGSDTAFFGVNRQSGVSSFTPNAQILFSNSTKSWSIRDIDGADANTFYTIVTEKYTANVTNAGIVQLSNSNTSSSITQALSLAGANSLSRMAENTWTQATTGYAHANGAYSRANTSANSFVGTTGSITPLAGVVNYSSNNGVVISGQGNTLYLNTPQDTRTTASPTFAALTLTAALPLAQGGTGSTNAADARTAILPTGTSAGYVLTTGGPGTFYWSAPSGGAGGTAPGTTINSTRLSYTGDGTTALYTAPTYTPGASQLRIYIDGVRQFASEYTETSNTSFTLSSAAPSGSKVLVEVDGYIYNPYYANNITFTAPFGNIISTANTIQLAIQDIETRKADLAGASFTGVVQGVTVDANTSNTAFVTAAFVKNVLNSGNTFTMTASSATTAASATNSTNATNATYLSAAQQTSVITGKAQATSMSSDSSLNGSFIAKSNGSTTGDGNLAGMTFWHDSYAIKLGVRADGYFGLGGWTRPAWSWYSDPSGNMVAAGNVTAYSDPRLKENFQPVQNALGIIAQLDGGSFNWKQGYKHTEVKAGKKDYGVLADQVEAVMPEIVTESIEIDGERYKTVAYEKLVPVLIEAIKELKAEIDAIKGK